MQEVRDTDPLGKACRVMGKMLKGVPHHVFRSGVRPASALKLAQDNPLEQFEVSQSYALSVYLLLVSTAPASGFAMMSLDVRVAGSSAFQSSVGRRPDFVCTLALFQVEIAMPYTSLFGRSCPTATR